MTKQDLNQLRLELSVKAKNGLDFIISAAIVWTLISFIWTLEYSSYDKSILTFIVGSIMLPMAFGLSKVLKTEWKIKGNPLEPLGLWLNFAQLFYFPLLVFVLIKQPDYFVMAYIVITGAHFFPYAWFYNEIGFAVMAGIISVGSFLLALYLPNDQMHLVALFMVICLVILGIWIYSSYLKKSKDKHSTN